MIKSEDTTCVLYARIIGHSLFGVVAFNNVAKRDSSRTDPVGYEERRKERVSIYGDMYPEAVATTVTAAEAVRLKALKPAQKGRKTRREALFNKITASREDCAARLIEYRIT